MVENLQFPVVVPYDDRARKALVDLEYAESAGVIARDLQPYLVQLPRQGYDALLKAGAIQPRFPDRYDNQFMELVNPDLYSEESGLHWEDPAFVRAENLCW